MPFRYRVQHLLNGTENPDGESFFLQIQNQKGISYLVGVLIILDAHTISYWRPLETSSAAYTHSDDANPNTARLYSLFTVNKESEVFMTKSAVQLNI